MENMKSTIECSEELPLSSSYEMAMEALSSLITSQKRGGRSSVSGKYGKLDRMSMYLKVTCPKLLDCWSVCNTESHILCTFTNFCFSTVLFCFFGSLELLKGKMWKPYNCIHLSLVASHHTSVSKLLYWLNFQVSNIQKCDLKQWKKWEVCLLLLCDSCQNLYAKKLVLEVLSSSCVTESPTFLFEAE